MIYCVEDDTGIREIEVYTLNSLGLEAKGFPDAKSFFGELRNRVPELVVLDVMLPDTDGIEVLKRLRSQAGTARVPVIMATARGAEYERISALDIGADDYLTKPFSMMEMAARVKAVLRRSRDVRESVVSAGGIVINNDRHLVSAGGVPVELANKEYELLYTLLSHPNRVYSRDQLLEKIWGTFYDGESRTVDVHIRTLRQKLGSYESVIKTVRGVGYKADIG